MPLFLERRRNHNNTRIVALGDTTRDMNGRHIVKDNNDGINIKTIAHIRVVTAHGLPTSQPGRGTFVPPEGTQHYIVDTTDGDHIEWYVDILDAYQLCRGEWYFIIENNNLRF